MKIWIIVLKIFGYAWLSIGAIAMLIGLAEIWEKDGFNAVQAAMSPFNFISVVINIVLMSPGLGAIAWANNLAAKKEELKTTI